MPNQIWNKRLKNNVRTQATGAGVGSDVEVGLGFSLARGRRPIAIDTAVLQKRRGRHQRGAAGLCLFCQHPISKRLSLEWSVQTIKNQPLCAIALNMSDGKMKEAWCSATVCRDASRDKPRGEHRTPQERRRCSNFKYVLTQNQKLLSITGERFPRFFVWSLIRPPGERGGKTDTWIFSLHFLWHFFFFFL